MLGPDSAESARAYCASHAAGEQTEFAIELVEGCVKHRDELDEIIDGTAEHWNHTRMPVIDRNILRLGVFELTHREDVPPKVAINEAIELARKYSTGDSPAFVNGVLDRVYAGLRGQDAGSAEKNGEAPAADPDPEGRADLHVHSTASDGSVAPEDIPALALKAGLRAVAITDHDAVEGVQVAREAAEGTGLEVVSGVELTAYVPGREEESDIEVHVLGLFIDPGHQGLCERLETLRDVRVRRIKQMSKKLQEMGFSIEDADVLARGSGSVGRMHLAQEMVASGVCDNIRQAFNRYIGRDCPAYVPKEQITPAQAVELVRAAGGCAVFAHPGQTPEASRLIEELAPAGLHGVEVHYPFHTDRQERDLMEQVRRLGLVVSGGSDFHGAPKPEVRVGQETISMVDVERLRKVAGRTV